MAEQIYPLTFESREFNPRKLGGLGVLNTPLLFLPYTKKRPTYWWNTSYWQLCPLLKREDNLKLVPELSSNGFGFYACWAQIWPLFRAILFSVLLCRNSWQFLPNSETLQGFGQNLAVRFPGVAPLSQTIGYAINFSFFWKKIRKRIHNSFGIRIKIESSQFFWNYPLSILITAICHKH